LEDRRANCTRCASALNGAINLRRLRVGAGVGQHSRLKLPGWTQTCLHRACQGKTRPWNRPSSRCRRRHPTVGAGRAL